VRNISHPAAARNALPRPVLPLSVPLPRRLSTQVLPLLSDDLLADARADPAMRCGPGQSHSIRTRLVPAAYRPPDAGARYRDRCTVWLGQRGRRISRPQHRRPPKIETAAPSPDIEMTPLQTISRSPRRLISPCTAPPPDIAAYGTSPKSAPAVGIDKLSASAAVLRPTRDRHQRTSVW